MFPIKNIMIQFCDQPANSVEGPIKPPIPVSPCAAQVPFMAFTLDLFSQIRTSQVWWQGGDGGGSVTLAPFALLCRDIITYHRFVFGDLNKETGVYQFLHQQQ